MPKQPIKASASGTPPKPVPSYKKGVPPVAPVSNGAPVVAGANGATLQNGETSDRPPAGSAAAPIAASASSEFLYQDRGNGGVTATLNLNRPGSSTPARNNLAMATYSVLGTFSSTENRKAVPASNGSGPQPPRNGQSGGH